MRWYEYIDWSMIIIGIILGFCVSSEYRLHKKLNEHIKACEKVELSGEKKELYFVVAYNSDGSISNHILADEVNQNSDKHEVVVREWQTGETYIFSYPCSVNNVTFAQDYIKFTNTK